MFGNSVLTQQTFSPNSLIFASIQNFANDRRAKANTKRTILYYEGELNLFSKWLIQKGYDAIPIEDITPNILREYFLDLSGRRNKGGVHCSYRVIRAFFNWYWEEYDCYVKNPMKKVKIPNPKIQPLPEMPLADIQQILRVTSGKTKIRDIALVKFLVDTGCRANECLSLNIGDISLVDNSVTILHGKGDKSRTTYFGKSTKKALKDYLATRNNINLDEPLFLNGKGNRLKFQGLRQRITNLCKLAGVKYRGLHAFRRTFGITLYRKGVDIYSISRLLGHSSVEVTKRYLAVTNDDLKAVFVNSPADSLD